MSAAVLVAILAIAAALYWVYASTIILGPDDVLLMRTSRSIDAGGWRHIWASQHIHLIPLYRLARLPFDLHFPRSYAWFHSLVLAAHLASAVILYLLARRYLRSEWAALVTAALFAWSSVGAEALAWKAAAPFAFSWTFLLLGLWCLARDGGLWNVAAGAALVCAVGFFSGALFAIPGVVVGAWLSERSAARRAAVIGASIALAGSVAWLVTVRSETDLAHYWKFGGETAGPLTRLGWAVSDTAHAYLYQLGSGLRLPLDNPALYGVLLLLALALFLLRGEIHFRWVLTALALTAVPLFVILLVRRYPEVWKTSRYGYQSYAFWAVLTGCVLDATLGRWEGRPYWRAGTLAVVALLAGSYLTAHWAAAREVYPPQSNQQAFWVAWDSFFRMASERRADAGKPLRLPLLDVLPGLSLHEIFTLCHPRGLPGLVAQPVVAGTEEEQDEFWRELERARAKLPDFPYAPSRPARGSLK